MTVRVAGVAATMKSGVPGAATTSATVVSRTREPAVPRMVCVEEPVGVARPPWRPRDAAARSPAGAAVVCTRSVLVAPSTVGVTEAGVNVAVESAGNPLTDRLTAPAKPLRAVRVTVY